MAKICLDCGHGGSDPGAVNNGVYEKDIALTVCTKLKTVLEQLSHEVVLTRTDDSYVSLQQRCDISNRFNPTVFVSIHCNSAENKSAEGIETWYCMGSTQGRELASSIQERLSACTTKDRGIKEGGFYVLKHTQAPSVLIEIGFLSNTEELNRLSNPEYQHSLVDAISEGITTYLNHQ